MSKENKIVTPDEEPKWEDYNDLVKFNTALNYYRDFKRVNNLNELLKRFNQIDPDSRQSEIARADVLGEISYLNPKGKHHVENDLDPRTKRRLDDYAKRARKEDAGYVDDDDDGPLDGFDEEIA